MLTLIDHADALSSINADQDAAVARDVTGTLAPHAARSDLAHTAHIALPEIINLHAHTSSMLTAHWYDGIEPSSRFRAKPFADVPAEQIEKVVDWALHAPGEEPPLARLVGSSQRLVRGASRQTITGNAAKEGVLWARYAKPTACAYCRALSMRGSGREDRKYLYSSDKSAIFRKSDGEKYHTHCECEPVPVRGGQIWTPPDYTAEWDNQYKEATRAVKTPKGDKKYFAHVVAQMRSNEVPEKSDEDKQAEADEAARDDALGRLDDATDLRDIEKIAKELVPDAYSISFTSTTGNESDPELAKGVVRALDDVAQAHPGVVPTETYVAPASTENEFASTRGYPMMGDSTVRMNSRWMTDPAGYDEAVAHGARVGFHYPGSDNPAYDTMIHELGHVMYNKAAYTTGIRIDADDVNKALIDYYIANNDDPTEDGYGGWLRDNLSGYSMADVQMPGAAIPLIDVDEALAEAFADTFINGDNAHESSQVLTDLLTAALAGQTYTDTRSAQPVR